MVLMLPPDDAKNLRYALRLAEPGRPLDVAERDAPALEAEGWQKVNQPEPEPAEPELDDDQEGEDQNGG